MTRLALSKDERNNATILYVKGEIGMLELPAFEKEIKNIIAQAPKIVIVDLAGLGMIGSAAMGMLVAFRREIGKSGGVVRLAAVNPLVFEALKRAFFNKIFEFYPTVEAALAGAPAK